MTPLILSVLGANLGEAYSPDREPDRFQKHMAVEVLEGSNAHGGFEVPGSNPKPPGTGRSRVKFRLFGINDKEKAKTL